MFWKFSMMPFYITAWRLKAGIVEPEETSIARQGLSKHVPAAKNKQITIEKLFESVFSSGSTLRLYDEDNPFTCS
jgi:hypothetical protein